MIVPVSVYSAPVIENVGDCDDEKTDGEMPVKAVAVTTRSLAC